MDSEMDAFIKELLKEAKSNPRPAPIPPKKPTGELHSRGVGVGGQTLWLDIAQYQLLHDSSYILLPTEVRPSLTFRIPATTTCAHTDVLLLNNQGANEHHMLFWKCCLHSLAGEDILEKHIPDCQDISHAMMISCPAQT